MFYLESFVLDELLQPVYNVDVSIGVVVPDVSGADVAFVVEQRVAGGGVALVAFHAQRGLHAYLAFLART